MQALLDQRTGTIVAFGVFPAGSPDPAVRVLDLDDTALARVRESGKKIMQQDGTIMVVPPPGGDPYPLPSQAHQQDEMTLRQYLTTANANPVLVALIRRALGM